ncbi:MAG: SRPBCC family protein [Chloroflexi bacterium]|nr:SRPBCC family protein [Chloroflexota bacterium]
MIRYSSEVTINRPSSVVFEALLDPDLFAQWTPMADVIFEDAGPPRVGSRGRFRMTEGPFKGPLAMEIVELEPNRRVAFQVSHPALDWRSVTTLREEGSGTRVTYAGEMSLRGWRRILEPIMGGEVTKGEAAEIRKLKTLLEGEATRPAAS